MSVKKEDGKWKSELSDQERAEKLKKRFDAIDDDVLQAVMDLYGNLSPEKIEKVLDQSRDLVYDRQPPSPKEFIEDDYYFGKVGSDLYPKWREKYFELFENGYSEVVLTGSVGCGKDFFSQLCLAKILADVWCLKDPQEAFGLASGESIHFACISIKKDLARRVVFKGLWNKMEQSPFFMNEVKPQKRQDDLDLGKNITVIGAESDEQGLLGMNLFGGIIDEANFFKASDGVDAKNRAEKIWTSIKRRMKSRFQQAGKLPGVLFVISSKSTEADFIEHRLERAEDDSSVMVCDYALWEVNRDQYSDETFKVIAGTETVQSRIMEEGERVPKELKENDMATIIDVPVDFRQDFEDDLQGSIRDLAGVSTAAVNPLIPNREKIDQIWSPDRKHPFTEREWTCGGRGRFLIDHLVKGGRPIRNPSQPRHVHIDFSMTQNSTGICMGHIGGEKSIHRRKLKEHVLERTAKEEVDESNLERAPIYVIDFLLRINPPSSGEIDEGLVRSLVYELKEMGFNIKHVSMDSFMSVILQKFEKKGIETDVISLDRKPDGYFTLKSAIYENRLQSYYYEPLKEELLSLEWDPSSEKVKEGKIGSKDVADAVAGMCHSFQEEEDYSSFGRLKPLMGGDRLNRITRSLETETKQESDFSFDSEDHNRDNNNSSTSGKVLPRRG